MALSTYAEIPQKWDGPFCVGLAQKNMCVVGWKKILPMPGAQRRRILQWGKTSF